MSKCTFNMFRAPRNSCRAHFGASPQLLPLRTVHYSVVFVSGRSAVYPNGSLHVTTIYYGLLLSIPGREQVKNLAGSHACAANRQ